jgi:RNA polymerase sigma factor (sigma-70 family)
MPSLPRFSKVALHLDTLISAVRCVARRRRLDDDQHRELLSRAGLKLLEREERAFDLFSGACQLRTYLVQIVDRLWIDSRIERTGKWRPMVRSKLLGTTVVRLDRLIRREGREPREAVEIARRGSARNRPLEELEAAATELAGARRPVEVPLGPIEVAEPRAADDRLFERQRTAQAARLSQMLKEALRDLPALERRALELRYLEGRSARTAATVLSVAESEVYPLAYAALRKLRRALLARGVDAAAVRTIIDPDRPALLARRPV